jgi:short-subunit dehydrogenase
MTEFVERFGPWSVVTGAAQGVGLACVQELVERGLGVVLVDRNPGVGEVAAALPGDTRAVVVDLTDAGWIDQLGEATADLEIGLAVANAGVSYVGRFLDMTAAQRDAILRVNCDATVALAVWALPAMVSRGRGGFVVISSGSALAGTGGVALYSATKAFVLNLAEAVGWELRNSGVVTQAVVAPSMSTPAFNSQPVDPDRMAAPKVDPRDVVRGALNALGAEDHRTCWLADDGLEFINSLDRRDGVAIISKATTGMYPTIFPEGSGES